MHVNELSTPAVVVDLAIVERNLDRMTGYCRQHGLGLRPHIKTHKMLELAAMQLQRGANGLTVAKVGEAEVMAAATPPQILVAHPIIGDEKIRRLAALPPEIDIIVALDSLYAAEGLSRVAVQTGRSLGVLVEFDSGARRCGVQAGAGSALLGQAIAALPGLSVRGLMTYAGGVWGDAEERNAQVETLRSAVGEAVAAFRKAGLSTGIVSAGSTPSAMFSHTVPGLTEIRPGTYIFNDLNTFYQGLCTLEDCAVRVKTTVVSTGVPGQVIVDAGSKVFSSDKLGSGPKSGFGLLQNADGATLSRLNEEHGYVQAKDPSIFSLGQEVWVIPNHVCTCINMHDEVYIARGEEVLGMWKVAARGKIR